MFLIRPALALAVILVLGLSACSDDEPPDRPASAGSAEPTPSPSPSPSPSPTLPPAPPADALQTAQDKLREAGTGTWSATVVNKKGGGVVVETGMFATDPPASLAIRNGVAERPRRLTTISDGPDLWFRAGTGADLGGCWAHRALDPQSPVGDLVPPPIQVLLEDALLDTATDTSITASVQLLTAAAPFGETVLFAMRGLDQGYGNVPVTFSLQDGDLTGYTITLDDVLTVAEAAGVQPMPQLAELDLVLDVELTAQGEPVTLSPPNPGYVVELGPQETVAEGVERCGLV